MAETEKHEVLNFEAAQKFLGDVEDPITRSLLTRAFMEAVTRALGFRNCGDGDRVGRQPLGEFDLLFYLESLEAVFREHDELRAMLRGEKPGTLFDDADQ